MRGLFNVAFLSAFVAILMSCQKKEKVFRLAKDSGVDFTNELNPTPEFNILTYLYYYNGGGVAIGDFNNDNLNDIYFTSNQGPDKLYINQGNLRFEDVTASAKILNTNGWTTGVTHVDINNDGFLDIYVCKVGGFLNLEGQNLLFVNQGLDENGIPWFKEDARAYNLDLVTFSTQAGFFDYDLDGDLDMFLLTHSVYPNRSYGKGDNRSLRDTLSGDRLLENVNGRFVDVTANANIFQNKIGYGLGLAIGDLNNDRYPDLYVGNDFFENDYCYFNNGDKTFSEIISSDEKVFGHTTHYSMGNSIADLNNDGRMDLVSLDMLPGDLVTLRSSGVEDGYPIYHQFLRNGYAPQFMQNTLHLNRGDRIFSEVGFQSGIAATDWSWGVLTADFDMDGLKDLYITNGIPGATNDMDFINFMSQEDVQRQINQRTKDVALEFSKKIPEKRTTNYAFKNKGDVSFENVSSKWFEGTPSFSYGCAYADLDNDGDLDIVVNNVGEPAFVFENLSAREGNKSFITLRFKGPEKNMNGIGARVDLYAGDLVVSEENFPLKSYLSSVPPEIVMSIGNHAVVDSLIVRWPDGRSERFKKLGANKSYTLSHANSAAHDHQHPKRKSSLVNANLRVNFRHEDGTTLDFDRDPLIPFALSNEGPRIAVADVNGDSLDDFFVGGAKFQAGALMMQTSSGELVVLQEPFWEAALSEDTDQVFIDVDKDGDMDLIVVSGGNEFTNGEPLRPRLYLNEGGKLIRNVNAFTGVAINASVVKALDIDNDGDMDIIIGSNALPTRFGDSGESLLFLNDGQGNFRVAEENALAALGNVNDFACRDIDGNGYIDIVAVGDWMPVTILFNDTGVFRASALEGTEGWWNRVIVEDFDGDGDFDFVAGNWGHNSRLQASKDEPIEVFRNDFDGNGAVETLLTYYYRGRRTVLSSKDELQRQMPFIKKKYQSYSDFANTSPEDLVSESRLEESPPRRVYTLSTSYFRNDGHEKFTVLPMPAAAQQSSVNAIISDDFNGDGFNDILLAGNNYEISTQLGRLDALHGALFLNDQRGFFREESRQSFDIAGPARDIAKVRVGGTEYYAVTINNGNLIFLRKEQ